MIKSGISIEHVVQFVTCWLQQVLGSDLRRCRVKGIKQKSKEAVMLLNNDQQRAEITFPAHNKGRQILVSIVVTLATMNRLMQYSVTDQSFQGHCLNEVQRQMLVQNRENEVAATAMTCFTNEAEPDLDDDVHCFTLPFKSKDHGSFLIYTHPRKSVNLCKQSRNDESSSYFQNSLNDSMGNQYLIVNGCDINSLKPCQPVSEGMVNFWLKWLSAPRSMEDLLHSHKVYAVPSTLLTGVICQDCKYTVRLQDMLSRVNIFEYKMLLFPVHLGQDWSLLVVLNPLLVRQSSARWRDCDYTKDVTAILHLDPRGKNNSNHNKSCLNQAILEVLNIEWGKYYDHQLDKLARPFMHRHGPCKILSINGEFLYL